MTARPPMLAVRVRKARAETACVLCPVLIRLGTQIGLVAGGWAHVACIIRRNASRQERHLGGDWEETPEEFVSDRARWFAVIPAELDDGRFNIALVIDGQYGAGEMPEMLAFWRERIAALRRTARDTAP